MYFNKEGKILTWNDLAELIQKMPEVNKNQEVIVYDESCSEGFQCRSLSSWDETDDVPSEHNFFTLNFKLYDQIIWP